MSSTLREIRNIFVRTIVQPRFWAVFAAVLMMFTFIGPFGTLERLELSSRFAYWAVTMLGSWFITLIVISIILGVLRDHLKHTIIMVVVAATLSALPCAWFIAQTIGFFFGPETPVKFGLKLLGFVLPIGLSSSFIVLLVLRHEDEKGDEDSFDLYNSALMRRLQPGNRGPVKYLSMQDHYVQVTTTRGTELVLMRMADAISALDPTTGLQVHRSYWVGRDYVSRSYREKGQPILVMDDGVQVPVSRSYLKAVKEVALI